MKIWTTIRLFLVLALQKVATAQSNQTCQDLESLASNAEPSLQCARNDLCTEVGCTITGELAPFFLSTKVILLPCADPPGIILQLTNVSSVLVVNESITGSDSEVIPVQVYFPQAGQFLLLGNVYVMVNSTQEQVGLEVVLSDGMIPMPVTIFGFTEVTLDRSLCAMETTAQSTDTTDESTNTEQTTSKQMTSTNIEQTTFSGSLTPTFTVTTLFVSLFGFYLL